MTDLTAGKSWSLATVVDPEGSALFFKDETEFDIAGAAPVEILLAAIASCFAKTCVNLMHFHRMPVSSVRAAVDGHTSDGTLIGKGLSAVEITVQFDGELDPAKQERLLSDARKLCTVSNSLSQSTTVAVAVASEVANR